MTYKLMDIDDVNFRCKESNRGYFYFMTVVLLFIGIPSMSISLTFYKILALFICGFVQSVSFYDGWMRE